MAGSALTPEVERQQINRFFAEAGQDPSSPSVQNAINLYFQSGGKYPLGAIQARLDALHLNASENARIAEANDANAANAPAPAFQVASPAAVDNPLGGLAERLRALSEVQQNSALSNFIQKLRASSIPQRQAIVNEDAALGRGSSGVSAERLNRFDTANKQAEGSGISDILGRIAGQNIGNEVDIGKFGADYGLRKEDLGYKGQGLGLEARRIGNQENQFNKTFDFEGRKFQNELDNQGYERNYNDRALAMSQLLGEMKANAERPLLTSQIFHGIGATGQLASGVANVKKAFF